MIKINLLPVRAAKKKETAVQQLSIFGLGVLLVLAITMSMYFVKRLQVSNTREDIATANAKISELKKKIGKLEELKTLKDQVKKKLDVLSLLRANKAGPAQRLATLSEITPEQLWLTAYTENGTDVKISGLAFTEELIANFMRSLEASPDFMAVELLVSEQSTTSGAKLKKFDLSCKLEPKNQPKDKPAAQMAPATSPAVPNK
jgi:type IV pilus assembly protein PilN